jgi:hypothetical protein
MGTKLGLHSTDFLRALVRRQLLLSGTFGTALFAAAALFVFRDTSGLNPAGAASWWTTITAAVTVPVLLGAWYARRAGDIEDEILGLVDVSTLPPSVTARVLDDALRGD